MEDIQLRGLASKLILLCLNTEWRKLRNLEDAKGRIYTLYLHTKKFLHDPALELIQLDNMHSILDFGCGVGRNISYLIEKTKNAQIYGYDFENMIQLAKEYLGQDKWNRVKWITPPIDNLRAYKLDLIIASLTFQHIPESGLRVILAILRDSLKSDGILYVHSRGWMDDAHKNVWKILLDYFIPISENFNPEDGSETHQALIFKKHELQS